MTAAAILTVIVVVLATFVIWLRSRTQKLSPALRAEYEELAEWAQRETTALKQAYGGNTGRVAADGDRSRRKKMPATTTDPRLLRRGWDQESPPCVTPPT